MAFENRTLRRKFLEGGSRRASLQEKITESGVSNPYSTASIIRMIKPVKRRRTGHTARVGNIRNYTNFR
jgi:hypothetical protein